jgi:DnaJ-class molecular chaperone
MRDPYEVLGVPRNASAAAIKSAFRKLAKKHHPDANNNDPKAAARFAEINAANEIVGDPDKRKQYDAGEIDAEGKPRFQGFPGGAGGFPGGGRARATPGGFEYSYSSGPQGGPGGNFEDILNSMFGGGAAGMRGGRAGRGFDAGPNPFSAPDLDVAAAMTVTLEEAANGAAKRVRLPTGKELEIKIPAGLASGQQIRLKGQGETAPGHPPGDVLITVTIAPHPHFKLEGNDLRLELPITLDEAVLGAKVRVPTLTGAVQLSIPKNTSGGRTFRLKGKGFPARGAPGDLFVTTRIVLPDGHDADLEALMTRWRETRPYNPRSDLG